MRKRSFAAILLFLATVTLHGQDKFRVGLQFSPNLGWIKPDNAGYSKDGFNLGFSYGLFTDIGLSERYAFATGLNVLTISGSNQVNVGGTVTSFTVKQQFVEIPLALKLKTKEIGYMTYFGKFGLSPGVNIRSRLSNSAGQFDYKTESQLLRMALVIALGTEYNISGGTSLIFGLEFNNGFTNIYSGKLQPDENGKKIKGVSNFIALNLGVCF